MMRASYNNRPAWTNGMFKQDLGGIWVRSVVELTDDHHNKVPVGTRMLIMCAGSWGNIYMQTPPCEHCGLYRRITADAYKIEPTGEPSVADPFAGGWR